MANRERGEVSVTVGGRDYTLVLTINAQCEIEERLSQGERQVSYGEFLQRVVSDEKPRQTRDVRLLFWGATRDHHPELSEKDVGEIVYSLQRANRLAVVLFAVLTGTQPDERDLDVAGIKEPKEKRPRKAQTTASVDGTGVPSISTHAASA